MTYVKFLEECRKLAGIRAGKEFSKAEFGRLCGKDEKYYTNMEGGARPPGRELLERAAEAAGLAFQDCIHLPKAAPIPTRKQSAISIFIQAVSDWREPEALDAAAALAVMAKPKRPKIGGRTRKK